MLYITIPAQDGWDEQKEEFVYFQGCKLKLEHSLISIYKWESHWHKPFLTKEDHTQEETLYYIKCMTLTQNVDPEVYRWLTKENMKEIENYISDPMTATTFSKAPKKGHINNEQVTAELIYYWMIALNIPVEFQRWHLNKLLTLIQVCNIKNQPAKKMSKSEILRDNVALNAMRRKKLKTRG